ncbi:hypothetical protein CPLU01_02166 [Colletotrichum plurivorum]|uniref:Uncharacterized protein n=1 Tax=Colletotrichum plurivorum TaxID=2175906 RepID=A0A8H6KX65_9PEZI|nr:hypothetical protein CPLU01_02166 [Colletotrichum plurivorum]
MDGCTALLQPCDPSAVNEIVAGKHLDPTLPPTHGAKMNRDQGSNVRKGKSMSARASQRSLKLTNPRWRYKARSLSPSSSPSLSNHDGLSGGAHHIVPARVISAFVRACIIPGPAIRIYGVQ